MISFILQQHQCVSTRARDSVSMSIDHIFDHKSDIEDREQSDIDVSEDKDDVEYDPNKKPI